MCLGFTGMGITGKFATDFSIDVCFLSMKAVVSAFYFLLRLTLYLYFKVLNNVEQ